MVKSVTICIFLIIFCYAVVPCQAETVRGMYGVSSGDHGKDVQQLQAAHVTAVFVPPDLQTIQYFKNAGFQVYLTLNVFGGSEAWKKYPDSVPLTASGTAVSSHHGGICPTHFPWREERLALLASWLKEYGTAEGIDGVWLDFLRYPGRWEEKQPEIPDTCYCPRCLELFQIEKGVDIPDSLSVSETADWIHTHAEAKWRQWKQEQISSFVRDARSVVDKAEGRKKIKLGVFLVPWTQGERQGAVLTHLAQDASRIARYADVLSPMVYHEMVGQPVEWVRDISEYFLEMTKKSVWPIIQAGDVTADEFAQAVQSVSQSGAEGLLVYSFSHMQERLWPLLKKFEARKNLLVNSALMIDPAGKKQVPASWQQGDAAVYDSKVLFQPGTEKNSGMLGITAGLDRRGVWKTALPTCDPGETYRFSADFFREELQGTAYPEIEVWGRHYLLNTHRVVGQFQNLRMSVQCPQELKESENIFSFQNSYPGTTFWLRNPELVAEFPRQVRQDFTDDAGFFPIGAYGASVENIPLMQAMGLNSAVIRMNGKSIDACIDNGMHCLLSVPHEPEELLLAVNALADRVHKGRFSFYVNDEPGIHSFPRWKAQDIQRILHDRFPGIPTSMAIVRPQSIPDYSGSSDYFMLDQYPVPFMPMTWLSESMDQAAASVGRNRLQSVIQAFGGSEWSSAGWPRLPDFEEMNCLAFLSVIHGSRGVYFYTFPIIAADEQGKKDFQRVVGRLQKMLPWLERINQPEPVAIAMLSANRFDPKGNPAVHCVYKKNDSKQMLLCVNTLSTYTMASVSLPAAGKSVWWEFFDGSKAMAVNGALQLDFLPLEVKAYVNQEK
ncbi:MAG: hypothetical protein KJ900_01170 [Proteobacteria bacterium]|nr:hypothetical protein [Desulfocapsa sp.]MBU3945163.1 hypothetical protein [Pseudomonadota bacterium]MCG2745807.1 hypothetical protein [Desulfobacteraceae bacterium]MBU4028029.1 hypothetical protein [Pseudomonadota bacterium]MBU4041500.1 hypothetical protein [Pseudomonadota bacterium]